MLNNLNKIEDQGIFRGQVEKDDQAMHGISNKQNSSEKEITDYGILTAVMRDPNVYEININGSEIKVREEGQIKDLIGNDGSVLSFTSGEQQDAVFKKLLGKNNLRPKYVVTNTSIEEGFRVAAIHGSDMCVDMDSTKTPTYNYAVVRKFNVVNMAIDKLLGNVN